MARREKSYIRMLKEGYGQGHFSDYKPWGSIRFGSEGRMSRPSRSFKCDREFLFNSDLESYAFQILDFRDDVYEIREQYPLLPVQETELIAHELNLKHPIDNTNGEPYVRTIDLFVTFNDGTEIAYQVKPKDQITIETIEKFFIEREYCKRKDIVFKIVTEDQVNRKKAEAIADIRTYLDLGDNEAFSLFSKDEIDLLCGEFYEKIIGDNRVLTVITREFESDHDLREGAGMAIFKHLLALRVIEVNLSIFDPKKKVSILGTNDYFGRE